MVVLQALGIRDCNRQVLLYAEVQHLLPTFSGPTATQGLENFQIQFKQFCGDYEISKSSLGEVLFSET